MPAAACRDDAGLNMRAAAAATTLFPQHSAGRRRPSRGALWALRLLRGRALAAAGSLLLLWLLTCGTLRTRSCWRGRASAVLHRAVYLGALAAPAVLAGERQRGPLASAYRKPTEGYAGLGVRMLGGQDDYCFEVFPLPVAGQQPGSQRSVNGNRANQRAIAVAAKLVTFALPGSHVLRPATVVSPAAREVVGGSRIHAGPCKVLGCSTSSVRAESSMAPHPHGPLTAATASQVDGPCR
ncbi:hypothetical protein BDV96DRAFT_673501 [Lophiotrema nucula]|uniref:Uncharacterized protein n=1 Tax=Lophiotrema nucula TaxID=690887 RepID=A0A6A5YLM4_9PLEO|nr:hypothetical protein BDV96DRAFT_673501 [Lophiotrema nucula]